MPRWCSFLMGLLLGGCSNSSPPPPRPDEGSRPRGEPLQARVADRGTHTDAPPAPSESAGAAGVVSNDGIGAFDRLSPAQRDALKQRRILWGHQSVGENLIHGAEALGFPFHTVARAADYGEARWGEAEVAENGDPRKKIESFVHLMDDAGIAGRVEAASFKFCWVDFEDGTDVDDLLDRYLHAMDEQHRRHPTVRFLHVTPPLTTDEPELNGIRWRYGRRLIERLRDHALVFDLAAVISTDSRGQQCKSGNQRRLCPEWSSDSGHLNDRGAQRAAKAFLYAWSRLWS